MFDSKQRIKSWSDRSTAALSRSLRHARPCITTDIEYNRRVSQYSGLHYDIAQSAAVHVEIQSMYWRRDHQYNMARR